MIFNLHPDWLSYFKSCWRRSESFANEDCTIDSKHELYIVWENTKFFLDQENYWKTSEDIQYDLLLLNHMAIKIDDYLVNHMLNSDQSLHRILYEWKMLMPIDPTKLE